MPLIEFTWERGADNKKVIFIRDARMSFAAIDADHISPEETIRRANLFCASPSMLALLEKRLEMIGEEAERRDQAFIGDIPSVQPYWTEMRDFANEIRVEIDRARGRAVPESELCPHGFGFVEYCPDCKPLPDKDADDYDYAADDRNFDAARERSMKNG